MTTQDFYGFLLWLNENKHTKDDACKLFRQYWNEVLNDDKKEK